MAFSQMELCLDETFATATPDEVFAALANVDNLIHWMPGLVSVERLNAVDGVGAVFRQTRVVFGRSATEQFEITAHEPGRSLELFVDGTKGSTKRGAFRFRYELTPVDGGTHMKMHGKISGMGVLGGLFGRLFKPMLKRALAKDLAALEAFVEGRGTP